jgi:diguanylate cyclase
MGKKVLIVDDDDQDRKGMAIALGKAGYEEILFAETAKEGFQKAMELKPDIVLIDVVLQNVDGFDVCKQIRNEPGIHPKIIMITGHLDAINAQKARTSGANEIVEKTAGFKNIGKVIESLK